MSAHTRVVPLDFFLIHPVTGRFFQISRPLVVGREIGDVTYPSDDRMSRSHFRVSLQGAQCFIEDLGSTNKTIVNGRILEPKVPVPLSFGAEIHAGGHRFVMNYEPKIPVGMVAPTQAMGSVAATTRSRAPQPKNSSNPSYQEIIQDLKNPSTWTSIDWFALGMSLFSLTISLVFSLEPVFPNLRWPIVEIDPVLVAFKFIMPSLVFFLSFSGMRKNSMVSKLPDFGKKAFLVFMGILLSIPFGLSHSEWVNAAKSDITQNCFREASRSAEQCKLAMIAAEKVNIIVDLERFKKIAPELQDEAFTKAYLEKVHANFWYRQSDSANGQTKPAASSTSVNSDI